MNNKYLNPDDIKKNNEKQRENLKKIKRYLSKTDNQIVLLLILLLLTSLFSQLNFMPREQWEYKVLEHHGSSQSREGEDAFRHNTINPSTRQLNDLGEKGWKVADTYLELETAFPNFGRGDYVPGIKSNVRPQKLVIILKRRK